MADSAVSTRAGQERLKAAGVVPVPDSDGLTDPYWQAAARGELRLLACGSCGRLRHPPSERCPKCGSAEMRWQSVSGDGTVYSFIVDHRLMVPGFDEPYVVAQINPVEAEDDTLRIVANVKECEPEDVYIGMPVEVFFEQRGGVYIPQFRARVARL